MFTKDKMLSLAHTFIAMFITTFATLIAAIPADTFFDAKTWAVSAILALIATAVRAGVKAISTSVLA